MDDGFGAANREYDRACLAEQRLKIAKQALKNIAQETGTPYARIATDALRDIKHHALKVSVT